MDQHTFKGKRKICSTNLIDFTDFQGIRKDPLYKRYPSVQSVVNRLVPTEYADFAAQPSFIAEEDLINWYVPIWEEEPERLVNLEGEKREKYNKIKEDTVRAYRAAFEKATGEDIDILGGLIRYINDDFIFCCDDRVYVVAWGMTPNITRHIPNGLLIHGMPEPPLDNGKVEEAPPVEEKEPEEEINEAPVPPPVPPVVPPVEEEVPPPIPLAPKKPWYKDIWKWLLWLLLAGLLFLILFGLIKRCPREKNGVVLPEKTVIAPGDTIDDFGVVMPIELNDGKLPEEPIITAPITEEDGSLPPIIENEGAPPVIGNRLIIFLESENDDVDAFARDFKKTYPGDQYKIIGYDRYVKSLSLQVPENERETLRETMNQRMPNHSFIVFDEEIYELNGGESRTNFSEPGWHLKAVNAPSAWQVTTGSPDVVVAVVDDGIDASHPMFQGRIYKAYNVFTRNNLLGYGEGHGTHTAGLAVGSQTFYDRGASGIAPQCKLMPVQVADRGKIPLSAIVSGIMYAVHNGADVINVSIGPMFKGLSILPYPDQVDLARNSFNNVAKLWDRVCLIAARKKSIIVFAAGNDDIISAIPPENRNGSAITVGAVDQNLYPTHFTDYGPCTDISAPGTEILSAFPGGQLKEFDGTSMAAPIVAGGIALMKSLDRNINVEQALNVLYRTGKDVYGFMPPMVQFNLALEAVKARDYSKPQPREVRPIPESALPDLNAQYPDGPPASIIDVRPGEYLPAPGGVRIPLPDGYIGVPGVDSPVQPGVPVTGVPGTMPENGVYPSPGNTGNIPGNPPGVTPGYDQGIGDTPAPVQNNGDDYDAIRQKIKMYKRKIAELEKQLPENQK